MEGEEGGMRLSKRFSDNKGGGEVDYKTKSGTAWSHNFLNQKPWHPLSYPNQRRKWIAEQTHAQRDRRAEEVAREYAQEQEFYRQTSLIAKKDKEKVELMQAVSFMYVRPPGFNAESAKAAELDDQRKREEVMNKEPQQTNADEPSSSVPPSSFHLSQEKKKPRPKDVFGRSLPTGEEFEILKNAPRLETGVAGRAKPFGVEIRNVKCLRCGNYGHQSGDRECPLKDTIMPSEESRLKRDDPLNAILAHTDLTEPLKWELKQKPGISPPRGGFKPDDPNQQIVADDIFDEYGGFLNMGDIPDLLTNFSKKPKKSKKKKHKKQQLVSSESESYSDDGESRSNKKKVKKNKKKRDRTKSSSSDTSISEKKVHGRSRYRHSEDSDSDKNDQSRSKQKQSFLPKDYDHPRQGRSKHGKQRHSFSSEEPSPNDDNGNYKNSDTHSYPNQDSDSGKDDRGRKYRQKHKKKHGSKRCSYSDDDSGTDGYYANQKSKDEHYCKSEDRNHPRRSKDKRSSHKYSSTAHCDSKKHDRINSIGRYQGSPKNSAEHTHSSGDSDVDKEGRSRRIKEKHCNKAEGSDHSEDDMSKHNRKKRCYSHKHRYHRSDKSRYEHSYSFDNSDDREKHHKPRRSGPSIE